MSRHHADPVEVLRHDEAPEQFLWHDRLHLVRAVLAHWVESAAWWRTAQATALHTGETPGSTGGGSVYPSAAALALAPLPETDRELWRVEASTGRAAPVGVFDLTYLPGNNRWFLTRVHD